MKKQYHALAPVYDELTADIDYKRRADFIQAVLQQHTCNGIVLDAGCGTGMLTSLLAARGYDMIGVDASTDMLSVAYNKAVTAQQHIVYLEQDLAHLDLFGTVNAVVCMQDTLNHIGAQLDAVLSRFSLFLEFGGIFIFDINSPYKHEHILGDNAFVYPFSTGMCIWQNRYEPEYSRVALTVDVFTRQDDYYTRDTDAFFEYTIKPADMDTLLKNNSFTIIEKLDGESYSGITPETQRILYVAKKI